MRLSINIFGNLRCLRGDLFNVSGSDSAVSQRITFSSRIVLKRNLVAKLVFEKMSKHTSETSKLPFLCLLKKLGCQRKWIRETFLFGNFDKLSHFESRNLVRLKFNLNFAIPSDFESIALQRTRFQRQFFSTNQILKKNCFRKNKIWRFYNEKNAKIGSFVFSFTEWIWEKNWNVKQFLNQTFHYEWVFQPNFSQLASFWMKDFTTCQMLNQYFYNA